MKRIRIIASMLLATAIASCSTPGPITGRPDPNVSSGGTLGSVKATDRPANLPVPHDTIRRDTIH